MKPWYAQSKYQLSILILALIILFLCIFACLKGRSQWNTLKLRLMARSLNLRRAGLQMVHRQEGSQRHHAFEPAGDEGDATGFRL